MFLNRPTSDHNTRTNEFAGGGASPTQAFPLRAMGAEEGGRGVKTSTMDAAVSHGLPA